MRDTPSKLSRRFNTSTWHRLLVGMQAREGTDTQQFGFDHVARDHKHCGLQAVPFSRGASFRKYLNGFSKTATTVYTRFQKTSLANDGGRAENVSFGKQPPKLCNASLGWCYAHSRWTIRNFGWQPQCCSNQARMRNPANCHRDQWLNLNR